MVQAIASGGPTPAAGYPGPYEIHLLQFGDTFESLAERFDIVDPDLTLDGLSLIHQRLHGSAGAS